MIQVAFKPKPNKSKHADAAELRRCLGRYGAIESTSMTDDHLEPPESSRGDTVHTLVRAGISAIPVLGGPAAELFNHVIQPPLEKRKVEWMNSVAERLTQLEQESDLDIDSLKDNDEFISAVMYASTLAIRTHNESKLNALRNAISNIAQGRAPDETLQQIYLNLVDSLTELHLRILKAFQDPTVPPGMNMGGLSDVLEYNLPDMRGQKGIYQQMWKDLFARGLLAGDNMNFTMSGNGLGQKQTTPLADGFLQFISGQE
tara:strand:- start:1017 stop:1793 length:777 start_codon:yes stop_codon:yes gene_type:complete